MANQPEWLLLINSVVIGVAGGGTYAGLTIWHSHRKAKRG